ALVARHLVERHGARHLLLTSRQGPSAPGADALRRELEHAGASVTIAACDVADPQALEALLDAIPDAHPLCAVVHAAGGIDDGLLTAMTPERIARVFALGLALFDAALRSLEPTFVPAALDLQALAKTDLVPPLLRGLVPRRSARPLAARSVEATSLAQRLSSLSPPERERALLDIVSAET